MEWHRAAHINFGEGAGVQEALDDAPDHLEHAGGVDDERLAHHLRVVVLVYGGDLAQQVLHLPRHVAQPHPCIIAQCISPRRLMSARQVLEGEQEEQLPCRECGPSAHAGNYRQESFGGRAAFGSVGVA